MSKILVLYYSSYGHTAKMAEAAAKGVRDAGGEADIMRVKETMPADIVKQMGIQHDESHAEISDPEKLADYHGIIVGTPTRYGRMSSQMASFWDTTGGLWKRGALIGKVGASFVSTASQHGGQETTQFSTITNLLHMGMTVVGLDYGFQGQMSNDAIIGGSPYGASTVAGTDGSREPHEHDLAGATHLGKRVAETADKLAG